MPTDRRRGRSVGHDESLNLWPSAGSGKAGRLRRTRDRDLFGKVVKPRDKNAEARRQAAIVDYVRWVAPHIRIWAVPNGGWRTKAEAARFKWTGVLAGVLDLTLALPSGKCAFWETKDEGKGLSDDQKAMVEWLTANGHTWAVVRTVDDARRELKRLGVVTREALTKENAYGHAANPY